jgi:hypothetical protein
VKAEFDHGDAGDAGIGRAGGVEQSHAGHATIPR